METSLSNNGSLGKMEIKWRGPLGESGRLQTQQIMAGSSVVQRQQVDVQIVSIPEKIFLCQPFSVTVILHSNLSEGEPVQACLELSSAGQRSTASMVEPSVVLEGPQSIILDPLHHGKEKEVMATLLALRCGVQLIDGLTIVDQTSRTVYGRANTTSIFVEQPAMK